MARRPYSQIKGPGPGHWDRQAVKPLPTRGIAGALNRVLQRQDVGGERCDSSGSTAIKGMNYNNATGRMTLTFPSGRTYAYFDVSPADYRAFCNADSKGRYFNSVIRDKYAYAKLG